MYFRTFLHPDINPNVKFLLPFVFSVLSVSLYGQTPNSDSLCKDLTTQLRGIRRSMDTLLKFKRLEDALTEAFSKYSSKEGKWVFNRSNANITKIEKLLVKSRIP